MFNVCTAGSNSALASSAMRVEQNIIGTAATLQSRLIRVLASRPTITMSSSHHLRQLLQAPAFCRTALLPPARPQARTYALLAPSLSHVRCMSLPRILQPSFWVSMVPKPLRSRPDYPGSREWNPATPYIILGLLVGSQAIQILWLKQEKAHSLRKAEAKLSQLKEVIERVQRGENVPVESILGTGNAETEREWADGTSTATGFLSSLDSKATC